MLNKIESFSTFFTVKSGVKYTDDIVSDNSVLLSTTSLLLMVCLASFPFAIFIKVNIAAKIRRKWFVIVFVYDSYFESSKLVFFLCF